MRIEPLNFNIKMDNLLIFVGICVGVDEAGDVDGVENFAVDIEYVGDGEDEDGGFGDGKGKHYAVKPHAERQGVDEQGREDKTPQHGDEHCHTGAGYRLQIVDSEHVEAEHNEPQREEAGHTRGGGDDIGSGGHNEAYDFDGSELQNKGEHSGERGGAYDSEKERAQNAVGMMA